MCTILTVLKSIYYLDSELPGGSQNNSLRSHQKRPTVRRYFLIKQMADYREEKSSGLPCPMPIDSLNTHVQTKAIF